MTRAILAAASLLWGAAALVDKKTLGVTGNNPYFPLTPGCGVVEDREAWPPTTSTRTAKWRGTKAPGCRGSRGPSSA